MSSDLDSASSGHDGVVDTRHERLLFRCWHHGTQEIDLILGSFPDRRLIGFSIAQPARFEALLDRSDVDLFNWVTRRSIPPPEHDHDVRRMLPASHTRYKEGQALERPLSPFMLPIWYRFQINSARSILHRLTGIAVAVGSILLAWWFIAVAAGGDVFAATHAFIASPIGILLLFLWSVALFYHLCNGIGRLARDTGGGFELRTAHLTGHAVLAATVVLTAIAWLSVWLI